VAAEHARSAHSSCRERNKDTILAIVRTNMAKVTSKFQVTVPKAIADRYRIRQAMPSE
jgi:hypothetical protein